MLFSLALLLTGLVLVLYRRRWRLLLPIDATLHPGPPTWRWLQPGLGLLRRLSRVYFRHEVRGLDRVPEAPCLLVGNHSGGLVYVDHWVFVAEWYAAHGAGRPLAFLGHDFLFRLHPRFSRFVESLGILRACPETARHVLESGMDLLVYPGGDWDSFRPFRVRNRIDFAGRQGYARLAVRQQVPVVGVVNAGAQETWLVLARGSRLAARLPRLARQVRTQVLPVGLAFPFGLSVGGFPPHWPLPAKLTTAVLEPLTPSGLDPGALARQLEARLQRELDGLAAERPVPVFPDLVDWLSGRERRD